MTEKFISALIDRFDASSIAELDFDDGGSRLLLRKETAFSGRSRDFARTAGAAGAVHTGGPAEDAGMSQTGGSAEAAARPGLPVSRDVSGDAGRETITSPIVATFYGSPNPDAPPFVKPGSRVRAGDSLCILEAMKMMNRLEAEFDCEIVSIKAASGDLVEYGQVLFEVKRL